MPDRVRDALALLVLRFGCAWFIFVWAVAKFLAPQQYADLMQYFDNIEVDLSQVQLIGAAQIFICLLVFVGYQRRWSYLALVLIHGFTLTRVAGKLIDPFAVSENGFPVNRNSVIALTVFMTMVALWLLRHRDHWSLDEWLDRRRSA